MTYTIADHLVTPRIGYTHHGLYAGENEVLEYSRKGVHLVTLNNFSEGNSISIEDHIVRKYSREESIQRGITRLGEDKYNVIFNNCERFVNWCINGIPKCDQIEGRAEAIAIEIIFDKYIKDKRLPQNAIEVLTSNPSIAHKLFSIFGNNKLIFNTLGTAMSASKITFMSSTLIAPAISATTSSIATSTIAGAIGGTAAGVGTGIITGSAVTAGGATVAGVIGSSAVAAGAIAAAPIAIGVGAAVTVGYGIKKLFDFFSD